MLETRVDDPVMRRSLDAMLRDTVTPTVLHAGKKVNVMPGAGEAEIDVRTLPGTDQARCSRASRTWSATARRSSRS